MVARSPIHLVLIPCALLALGGTAACASSGGGGSGGDPDRLTLTELETVQELDAYEAVRRLRPTWLQSRGAGFYERATATVYVDGMRQGGLDELSGLDTGDIQEIRFLSASEATTRFGTNNLGGAIVVTTRNR